LISTNQKDNEVECHPSKSVDNKFKVELSGSAKATTAPDNHKKDYEEL
jgi:hypothetical protein